MPTSKCFFNLYLKFFGPKPKLHHLITQACCGVCTVTCPPVAEQLPEVVDLHPHLHSHREMYEFSIHKPNEFWAPIAKSRILWNKMFDQVSKFDMNEANFQWFVGGKLNVTESCVDRHAKKNPNKIALIWEKDEAGTQELVTYQQLYDLMNQIANLLKSLEVEKGDRVAIYMPVSPMAVAAMLACARIGAVHNVVFAGFSAEALATRINDAQADIVITADQAVRGGKLIELKKTVDEALKRCPRVRNVLMMERTKNPVPFDPKRDILLTDALDDQPKECPPEVMDSEDILFMLYTSGSTGKPKGLIHTQAGYLLQAMLTHKLCFNYQEGDIFGCVADIGWITGHSYVIYGPLANGATTVLFESIPTYPDPGRYWEAVQRLRINQFYGSPTAVRTLLRYDQNFVKKYDRSSLKVLGSVGEPINHEAWEWLNDVVGERRCMLVDTWWQTETGGICISPCPADPNASITPAIAMRPFYGIRPVLVGEKGNPMHHSRNSSGSLCISQPWPGMARSIFNDHERYVRTYFRIYHGLYFTGDGAQTNADGFFQITGRVDDVINVSGHRLGTAEIEDIMDEHPFVAESAVVGFPHEIKGEGVFAFVILRENVTESESEAKVIADLRAAVKKAIASYAVPDFILVTPGLPKTRSGKIMRRILRKIASGNENDLGDVTTLADPSVVQGLVSKYQKMCGKI